MAYKVFVICIATVMFGCAGKGLSPEEFKSYESDIEAWHVRRIEKVKAPDGWLNLVGLHWLKQGVNSFGSSADNNIVFPEGKIAAHAGFILVQGERVSIQIEDNVEVTADGKPVRRQVIFQPDSIKPVVLESGSLRWTIIRRDHEVAVRLRDLESPAQKHFKTIERFPIDPKYRVSARFEPADSLHTIDITNVVGQTTAQASPGTLVFELEGKTYKLAALTGSEEEFFIIFGDETSGKETYSAGRFLYVPKPKGNEEVIIDFNKAYNPPCVFTPYATCPFPPKQNILPIAIVAGEKDYKLNVH